LNKLKSFTTPLLNFILTASILLLVSSDAYSQTKYDVKLLINEKVLFTGCVKMGSKLYVSLEEMALKIDGSVSIEAPYKIGPYFKFKESKVSLIKTGSANYAELNVNKKGVLSANVKIIILDGKKHAFIPFEEFVSVLGGTWKYDEATEIYGVTVGGCGACLVGLIDEQ